MGWKSIKEHYRISHTVQVRTVEGRKQVWIGSAFIPDIIVINDDGEFLKCYHKEDGWSRNADLVRYQSEMDADMGKLHELLNEPDDFTAWELHEVWVPEDGRPVKKYCQTFGYPANTTDGGLLSDNGYFHTRKACRQYILQDTRMSVYYVAKAFWNNQRNAWSRFTDGFKGLCGYVWRYIRVRITF